MIEAIRAATFPLIDADEEMSMRLRALIYLIAFMIPALASAGTITVRKDGTGDYSVVQEALNAAAAGDTILIGPGNYSDHTTVQLPGWSYTIESYAVVTVADLTLIGAGANLTSIGPTTLEGGTYPSTPQGLTCDANTGLLTICDLAIENCDLGAWVRGALVMDSCRLIGNSTGMIWMPAANGGQIRDTTIEGAWSGVGTQLFIGTGAAASSVTLERCHVVGGIIVRAVQGMVMRDCEMASALLSMGASVLMVRCVVSATGTAIVQAYGGGIFCELQDCDIRGAVSALEVASSAPTGRFLVANSRLEGGSQAILMADGGSGICVIHGSDLIKGAGPTVVCGVSAAVMNHDLTANWWGTTSTFDIESWIIDRDDDPAIGATVLYSPFAGQSVPTESTSWGDLKASYR